MDVERKRPRTDFPMGLGRILGRSPVQRHLFHLAKLGLKRCVVIFEGTSGAEAAEGESSVEVAEHECRRQMTEIPLGGMNVFFRSAERPAAAVESVDSADAADSTALLSDEAEEVMLLRGEAVYDPRLYRVVWEARAPICIVDRPADDDADDVDRRHPIGLVKWEASSLRHRMPEHLQGSFDLTTDLECRGSDAWLEVRDLPTYLPSLRRHLRPYWCPLRTVEDTKRAARMIMDSAQKGVLDLPAQVLHPVPENFFTRWLARTPITPNHVTVLTGLVAFGATALFAIQSFAWGLAVAFLVNVLDGVDGKLARVKLLASRFGDRLDHILDVTFEFSWYLGLGWGLYQKTGDRLPLELGATLIGVMLASRAMSGIYRLRTGRQIHDHRAFDRAFRRVAGRRNIYIVVLIVGLAAGQLEGAFYFSVGWGVVTLLIYGVRTLMARTARSS